MKDQEPKPVWDTAPLAERFSTPSQPVRDVAFGNGERFAVTADEMVSVEVFPAASVTRVRTADSEISLHRSNPPQLSRNGVLFENTARDTFLIVLPDGTVGLRHEPAAPLSRAESPSKALFPAEGTKTPPTPPETVLVSPDSAETGSLSSSDTTEQEKQERVSIRGRVGKAPRFRTTQKGRLVANFQLAERDENDKTTWHSIVAFDKRAEKVQTDVQSGMPLEVIGYVHEHERELQDGTKRIDRKIYAVAIKTKV